MSPTYAQNKIHIYNYKAKNPDKIRECSKRLYAKRVARKAIKLEFLAIRIDY